MVNAIDNPWDRRADAVRAAVAAVRREGTELSVRLVFRASRSELRRAGIATPDALYNEMRQVFWNADEGIHRRCVHRHGYHLRRKGWRGRSRGER